MPFDLSAEQLAKSESEIGAKFPESYRARMMASNGGSVSVLNNEWELIPFRDTSTTKRLSRTANNHLVEVEQFKKWSRWPEGAVAIAANGCGDALLFLKVGSEFDPRVFVWWHETGQLVVAEEEFSSVRDV